MVQTHCCSSSDVGDNTQQEIEIKVICGEQARVRAFGPGNLRRTPAAEKSICPLGQMGGG